MEETCIPYHFVCPISLQIMRDPVTVSTGITYDRESIERWLYTCRNTTCPATKQILYDQDLIPNHTLRRLIQAWCTLNASSGIERIPTPKPPMDETRITKLLSDAKRFPHRQLECLRSLRAIVLESEKNKMFLEESGAVIDFLASILKKHKSALSDHLAADDEESESLTAIDEALSILYHLKVSETRLKNLISKDGEFMGSLLQILRHGSRQSRAYSTMILKPIFEVADPVQLISVSKDLLTEIVHVLRDQISPQASQAALKLLVEVCSWGKNRIKSVEAGAVPVLIELLLDTTDKRACELILTILDTLCGCAVGRAEFLNHGAGLAVVSMKILRVSHLASDKAVKILGSVCRHSATPRVLQEMLQVGVVAKLCSVLQVESSLKSKERAREILKLHSKVWRNSPCLPALLI